MPTKTMPTYLPRLLLVAAALTTSAVAADSVDLRQAITLGLDNSYSVRALEERIQARELSIAFNESQLKTQVTLSASGAFSHNRNYDNASSSVQSNDVWPFSGSLSATYPLYTSAILQQLSLDGSELAKAKLERQQERLAVIDSVFKYYLSILELHDSISLQQSLLEALRSRELDTQIRLDNGVGNRLDLIQIEADLAVAEAQLLELEADLAANYLAMEQLTGSSLERLRALRADAELPKLSNADSGFWRNISRGANIELLVLQQSLNSARESARLVEKSYAPSLSAFARLDPGMNYQDSEFQESSSASVGISFSYSLHDSGKRSADIARSLAEVRELERSLEAQQQLIDISIDQLVQVLRAQTQVIAARARSRDSAEEQLNSSKISYANGVGDINQILDAENELQQAANSFNQSVYSYLRNYFDLLNTSGQIDLEQLSVFYELLEQS